MEFSQLVQLRQSDRKYEHTPVEKDKILQCLSSARLAPSACNSQPWKFIVVDDPVLRQQVAETAVSGGMNKFALEAPVVIAVVLERMNFTAALGSVLKNKEYALMDVGIAVNQLCLQAAELGLGTCIIGWFNENKLKELLAVPKRKRVPLLITLGYPASPNRKKVRKAMEEVCGWNNY